MCPAVPQVEPVPDGVLGLPDDEEGGDVGHAEEDADGGQSGGPGFEPPGQLLLAAEGVFGANHGVAALPGDGLVGVDEVVGAVCPATADLQNKTEN